MWQAISIIYSLDSMFPHAIYPYFRIYFLSYLQGKTH